MEDLEYFLLNREEIYKQEKHQRRKLKIQLSWDWDQMRKRLKKMRKKEVK